MNLNLNLLGVQLKVANVSPVVAVVIGIVFALVLVCIIPMIFIWCVGTLFGVQIPYSFETFAAIIILIILVKGGK